MFERFSAWYFGPDMEERYKSIYLWFIAITQVASLLAMFGPVRGLGPALWMASVMVDWLLHGLKVDGWWPLSMLGGSVIISIVGVNLLILA